MLRIIKKTILVKVITVKSVPIRLQMPPYPNFPTDCFQLVILSQNTISGSQTHTDQGKERCRIAVQQSVMAKGEKNVSNAHFRSRSPESAYFFVAFSRRSTEYGLVTLFSTLSIKRRRAWLPNRRKLLFRKSLIRRSCRSVSLILFTFVLSVGPVQTLLTCISRLR